MDTELPCEKSLCMEEERMKLKRMLDEQGCARRTQKAGARRLSNSTYVIWGVLLFALVCTVSSCNTAEKSGKLEVIGGKPIVYQAENGDRMTARYYSLSDKSLDFVKVTMPDGKEYTLPRVLSASGVRYTDDMELVWWNKGNTAHVEKRDENGEWQILYSECVEVPGN